MKENCTMCRHLNRTDIAASGICMNTESDKFAYQVGKLDRCEHFEMIKPKRQDLSYGLDGRGDYALFIDARHIQGWNIDTDAKRATKRNVVFFRVIDNGEEQHGHGFIVNNKIVHWG